MLTDGELSELFTHSNSRAMQSSQKTETKRMIAGNSHTGNRKRGKVYTALIFFSGSLLSVSFGTMLGWPSPTYPQLLKPDGPIYITVDQSAMIAGMLMNGFVVATPLVGFECLGSKFGVLFGAAFMLSGWLLMTGAREVLSLCISRILVGFGGGFGTGKFKTYLKEICLEEEGIFLSKQLPLFVSIGMIISFSVGPFVSFRWLPIVASVIPGVAFLTFIIVPDTPHHLLKQKKLASAISVLQNMHGKKCVDEEIENVKFSVENKPENKNIFQILKDKYTRKSFFILTFLMLIQQFSGGPSLIVYSQIVFTEFNCFYPPICSIVYAIAFLFSTAIGIKYVHLFKRKPLLLLSLSGCALTSACHLCYLYFAPENIYYSLIPFISMLIYVFCHTAGISTITNLIVNDIFPKNARYTMGCYWNMFTAELAVIVTKIFQVLFDRFGMYIGFCLYTSVSIFGFFVILLFFAETKGKLERNRIT